LVRLDRVAAAPRSEKLPFLLTTQRNSNVWRDTVAVNDLLTRGVISRGRKAQGRSVRQLHHILDGSFSKSCFAHDNRAMQIFERAADDFRTAGAAFIHQNRHRKIWPLFRD